jgi:hypothetical protein
MRLVPVLLLSLTATVALRAADPLEGTVVTEFKGSATMGHKFTGAVTSRTFRVEFHEAAGKTLADFAVESEWSALTTFHKKRDKEMREHFKTDVNPLITGTVKDFDWSTLSVAEPPAAIPFEFAFAGGKIPMTASVSQYKAAPDGTVTFDAAFTVSQKACGCEPITMMAVMKVHDPVPVIAHVTLRPVAKP